MICLYLQHNERNYGQHQSSKGTLNSTDWELDMMTEWMPWNRNKTIDSYLSYNVGFPCRRTSFCIHPWRNPPCLCRWGGPAFLVEVPSHCRSVTVISKYISIQLKYALNLQTTAPNNRRELTSEQAEYSHECCNSVANVKPVCSL